MGKDRSGNYHPPKGKPSGGHKEEGLGLRKTMDPDDLEQDEKMTERYTTGPDELAEDVPVRHPNRNTQKNEDYTGEESRSYKSRNDTYTEGRSATTPEELPGVLTKEMFAELAGYQADCCVSFYIQTNASGVEVNEQKDMIKFKNHLQDLQKQLSSKGVEEPTIQKMLEPGYELLRDDSFWTHQTPGLAVFLADGFFKYIKMPLAPAEEVLLDKTFYVTPLIPIMTKKEYFYLLVISKKQAKLFKADAFGMEFMNITEIPNGIDDVVRNEEKDDEQLFRQGSRGGNGGASFHGHGGGAADEKTQIGVYLEEVDDTIWKEVLHNETAPLLLAGVEYLIPIYRKVSDYNHLWEDALTGSYEHVETSQLYQQAMEKMKPYFEQRTKKAIDLYGNQSATSLTSSIPADIVPAAYYGKIAHLFVEKGAHIWGTFDEIANELKVSDEREEGDECLVDNTVEKTILNGGEVHILEREQMPVDSSMAAVMRY